MADFSFSNEMEEIIDKINEAVPKLQFLEQLP
jgi:hypothetical protein